MTIARVLPAVAGDTESAADAAGCQYDRATLEDLEAAALSVVRERAGDPIAILDDLDDGALHVHFDSHLHRVVLERADHLQAGAVADVCKTRILMAAEVSLKDAAVRRSIEDRTPRLELTHPVGRFLRV